MDYPLDSRMKRGRFDPDNSGGGGADRATRFQSIKRKLNFDEDTLGMQAYEAGELQFSRLQDNPFYKLLSSGESVPKFEHRAPTNEQQEADT